MNKKVPFILMTLGSILLTACDSKIGQERFTEQLNATKANISIDSESLDNVHMSNKLDINVIDYKKGEYYINTTFALALFIPIIQKYYTWTENGKYYHAEEHTIQNLNKYEEITKEQFDVYMSSGRVEVCAELNKGVAECEKLMNPSDDEVYYDIKNSFYRTASGEYKFSSKMNYKEVNSDNQEEEKTRTVTFLMKNNLPVKYSYKTDGESYYKYSFGKAELRLPSDDAKINNAHA